MKTPTLLQLLWTDTILLTASTVKTMNVTSVSRMMTTFLNALLVMLAMKMEILNGDSWNTVLKSALRDGSKETQHARNVDKAVLSVKMLRTARSASLDGSSLKTQDSVSRNAPLVGIQTLERQVSHANYAEITALHAL